MTLIRITKIKKDYGNHYNPHEAISHYRWIEYGVNGLVKHTGLTLRDVVVGWLEGSLGFRVDAYVEESSPRAYCTVRKSLSGTKYLQTDADANSKNNLLNLPEEI